MLRAALAAAVVALVVPVSAQAALTFAFDRAQARIGQPVHAYQADFSGKPAPAWEKLEGVTLYSRASETCRTECGSAKWA